MLSSSVTDVINAPGSRKGKEPPSIHFCENVRMFGSKHWDAYRRREEVNTISIERVCGVVKGKASKLCISVV